ncbi:MAG: methionyl-tRNA synthetase [Alectoria sarmentosa]|nr:MAG: methionyl-tRNA synthetase [Alectoria sarmentosa]
MLLQLFQDNLEVGPIFYVNGAPHIGHLYTLVLADILKRWHALLGRKSILVTGTDEHGMKVQQAAEKAGQEVRAFCDEAYKPFQALANEAHIDYDHFIRTSEPDHRFAVQHFWLMLRERGWIYAKKHEGWYSVSDETFYPQSAVQLALDPATGRKFTASKETGKEVEWTSENNYHFRLSAFHSRLREYYSNNNNAIVPRTRMKDVQNEIMNGLQDLSISRPLERLSWGIPVPDDATQTIYVWLDALINYLTKANYPFQIPGQENAAGWPADCHVIGKDIVRFHCIYWPAFLMALDLPLPKQIFTHAHWTLGTNKMSKSTGMVVNPFFAINRFGVDCMRYYLALEGGIRDDSSYDNSFIIARYKSGLQSGLGNLVSRVTRGKGWDVRRAVKNSDKYMEQLDQQLSSDLRKLNSVVLRCMELPDPREGLRTIMTVVYSTNAYMQSSAPWDLDEPEKQEQLDRIIYLCAESLRVCGILLQPYMPAKMKQLLDMLGVAEDARMYSNASLGKDQEYGEPKYEIGKKTEVLFPPLTSYF